MVSRLPTHLHPVAGRPLVWHAVSSLLSARPAPDRVLVLSADLPDDLFSDISGEIPVTSAPPEDAAGELGALSGDVVVLVDSASVLPAEAISQLVAGPTGARLVSVQGEAAAVQLPAGAVGAALRGELPTSPHAAEPGPQHHAIVVRDRASLSEAGRAVRDSLVAQLMAAGVTFLLPGSVMVDVDVRIGQDSVIYPGAILEGQTTVGEETVIGPSCRIVSSWIGSGVEMKGWNYIAHTSVRNRAILEPYVRRGFD